MLFNSFEFLFFLPIVFLLYWFVFSQRRWQNLLIVVASYVFYGWWDWRFLFLIAFTSFCSYFSGLLLVRYDRSRKWCKVICGTNIVINLLILGLFKYYNFFMDNISAIFQRVGYSLDWVTLDIILPIGISFYTFQALSYTIDVYQKKVEVTRDVIEFFAFISFFPQLVAGPIERAKNLLPQFGRDRQFDYAQAVDGLRQMLWGFFKKVVIADNCGSIVNEVWESYTDYSGINLFVLGLLFTFQIYCDFSGYSDIAIGCARLFGIRLLQNFNYPYFSRNISEFWRRWHISLMSWFRDYIYFPLGGSRCSKWKTYRNTLIVFGVSGLWHGANWTFVFWGFYNAVLIIIWRVFYFKANSNKTMSEPSQLLRVKDGCKIVVTFILVLIGWIIFRAENLSQAIDIISRMFITAFNSSQLVFGKRMIMFGIIPLMLVEYVQRSKSHVLEFPDSKFFRSRIVRWGIYLLLMTSIVVFNFSGESQEFIYFQF